MSIRKVGVALASVCASLLIVPVAAGARTPTRATGGNSIAVQSLNRIPVTGTASNHKAFSGHFTVTHFVTHANGTTYAVGTLVGHAGRRQILRSNVQIPVSVANTPGMAKAATTCPILHLVLGPLDLNLLGLKVHLNKVVLDITAQSGPGNLLGNLLCSVANLLNGNPLASDVSGLLNVVNAVLNDLNLLQL